jgi:formamidopyrimidine-DNA glycosylase
MPELPDVEQFKQVIERHGLGPKIDDVTISDGRVLDGVSAQAFRRALRGNRFEAVHRHGKHLLVRLARGGWVTFHFGMTGALIFFKRLEDEPRFDRVRFDFEGKRHLGFVDRRVLGRIGMARDAEAFIAACGLGPDLLDPALDWEAFEARLSGRRGMIKAVLMDQALFAGAGNVFSDEILYRAALHPKRKLESLTEIERKKLFRATKWVLNAAVKRRLASEAPVKTPPHDWLLAHRKAGDRCPAGGTVKSIKLGGRTTYFCPSRQKLA